MKITKREVLVSIAIACLMFTIGLLIQQSIRTGITNQNKEYQTALQISDAETFAYAMRTSAGNAFVYGPLTAVAPVTNEEIDGEWLWIERVKERYTQHTRTVTMRVNGKSVTRVEHYWTWDRVGSQVWHSETYTFLGAEFSYGLITGFRTYHLKTDTHGHVRYKWYVSPPEHEGTIYTKLENGTITQSSFHEGMDAAETFQSTLRDETGCLIGFWILWTFLTAGLIIGFCSLENCWLE